MGWSKNSNPFYLLHRQCRENSSREETSISGLTKTLKEQCAWKGASMDRIKEKARLLLEGQIFAVLCTQGQDGPYASLMAYVYEKENDKVFMVTKTTSEKVRNIQNCPRVALLVDDRIRSGSGKAVSALTVEGTVVSWLPDSVYFALLETRFPALKTLLDDPETVVLCIELDRFLLLEGPEKAEQGSFRNPPGP